MVSEQNRPWWVLIAASSVLGLVVLDETVVGVALPTMRADLRMSVVASHWVVNAYLLAFSAFLAVGGRLGDMLGRRRVFPAGAALFVAGSLLAAAAPSGGWLIAGRPCRASVLPSRSRRRWRSSRRPSPSTAGHRLRGADDHRRLLHGLRPAGWRRLVAGGVVAMDLLHQSAVLDRSPIEAGLVVSVAILPTLATSRVAGAVRDRYGVRLPLTLTLAATTATLAAVGAATVLNSEVLLVAVMVMWGAVVPFIAVTARPAVMGAVPSEKHGQASGVNLSIQMLGGTIAIAVCSPLLLATGAFWPVFAVTAGLVAFAAAIAWRTVERAAPSI